MTENRDSVAAAQPVVEPANLLDTQGREAVQRVSEPIISLKDIKVYHRSRTGGIFKPNIVKAVDGVSMDIRRGETIGIVGESGCGKSTLASVIVGLQKPTGGQMTFKGQDASKRNAAFRKEFGSDVSIVFQDPSTALNPRMTVQDILKDPLDVHGIGNKAGRDRRVRELLSLVGLPVSAADALPSQISGGQRQRVAIARAIALEPKVIVADEPTSALDVSVRAQVLNLLSDLKKELFLGMVFISHDIQTVRYVSDRICVMNKGKIVEEGTASQVFDTPSQDYTRKLLGAAPTLLHV